MSPYLRLQRLLQSQLRMIQTVKPNFLEESLFSLFYLSFSKPNLLVNARVKRERANFLKHRHALILLNIARRYRMDHHSIWKRSINHKGKQNLLKTNILNAWLETRPANAWDLDKFLRVRRDVVPCAMKGDR